MSALLAALLVATAPSPPGFVIERAAGGEVSAVLLNDGDARVEIAVPDAVAATMTIPFAQPERGRGYGTPVAGGPVTLRLSSGQPRRVTVPAHGFVRVRYAVPELAPGTTLTVPGWSGAAPVASAALTAAAPAPSHEPAPYRSADGDTGNRFLASLSAYEPVYAVYGPGTDTDARLQISFKYQLLGEAGDVGPGAPWANGIHFAFTQRLYWNLGAESSPFRNVDYLPELFYLFPARPLTDRVSIGGQAGFRHESNGRAGLASRSFNTIYVQPVASMPLGDWTLSLSPRAWLYVGSREDNPDIRRYRGNTGLFAEIGQDDGLRLGVTSRIDFGSGRGAVDALVSYPLTRLIAPNLKLYAFGQAFAGYGENLLDYRRRTTRLRAGLGLVR